MTWIKKDLPLWNDIVENKEILTEDAEYLDIGAKVRIYPFRIVSGTQLITKNGEVDILTNINKEGQYANFYTGNNQITIVWEGSTTLSNQSLPNKPNNPVERLEVGRYIDLLSGDDSMLSKSFNETSINLYGIDYSTTETHNTLSLIANCDDRDIANKQWSFIEEDDFGRRIASSYVPTDYDIQNYVYLILDPRYQSYQWLRIKNVTYAYNNLDRRPVNALIEFETINNDFSNTGKSILQYFQHGNPNGSYAFPKETYTKDNEIVTTLEIKHIRTQNNDFEGVDSIQYDFMGGYALSSIGIIGRPLTNDNYFTQNETGAYERSVGIPRWLMLYESERVVESPFINRIPNQNVYIAYNMVNDVDGVYQSYKDAFGVNAGGLGGYNVTATKQIITGMRPSKDNTWSKIVATNPIHNDTTNQTSFHQFTTWQTKGMNTVNWIDNLNQKQYLLGVPNFVGSDKTNQSISITQFLNQNHWLNFGIEELTTQYTESTKYKISDILGTFGNLFSMVTGGLDIGFITNKTLATGQTFNVLLPCLIVDNARACNALPANGDTNVMPLDGLNDQLATKAIPINSNLYTAYRFSLTHLIVVPEYGDSDINWIDPLDKSKNVGRGYQQVWDTKYLGQTTDENGNLLLTKTSNNEIRAFTPNLYTTVPIKSNNSYTIDYTSQKGVGICDQRISMYKGEKKRKSVYQLIAQTKSKVKNNITLWANEVNHNYYDQFNTFGTLDWPVLVLPTVESENTEDNRQISINPNAVYIQQTFRNGVKKNFKNNINDSFTNGNGNVLWSDRTPVSTLKQQEDTFKQYSRVENVVVNISNDNDLHGYNEPSNLNYTLDYDIVDLKLILEPKDWYKNDTFDNLSQLKTWNFKISLNSTPNQATSQENDLSVNVLIARNGTGTGDLDELLKGNELEFPFKWEIDINNSNDLSKIPNNFAYPLTMAGDYLDSDMWTRYYDKIDNTQRPPVTKGGVEAGWGKSRWTWIFSPLLFFNENLSTTYNFNGANILKDIVSLNCDYTINYNTMYTLLCAWPVQGDVPRYANIEWQNKTVAMPPNASQVFNLSTGIVTVNNKPTVKGTNGKFNVNGTFKIKIDLFNKELLISFSQMHCSLSLNTTYQLADVAQIFNCRLAHAGQNTTVPIIPNINTNIVTVPNDDTNSYFFNKSFVNPMNCFYSSNGNNFPVTTFMDTTFNGNEMKLCVQMNGHSARYVPMSTISPMLFFNTTAGKNWVNWLSKSISEQGSLNNVNFVQELNDLKGSNNFLISDNGNGQTINTTNPLALGGWNTSFTTYIEKNMDDNYWGIYYSYVPSSVEQPSFQWDNTLNFQPLLALESTTTWNE